MTFFEDDRPKKPTTPRPGENLADLSIEELKGRIELYRGEIERLAKEVQAKETSRQAADSFFRL
jgi:uncharacterized small protein (DUF1192 family)